MILKMIHAFVADWITPVSYSLSWAHSKLVRNLQFTLLFQEWKIQDLP